MSDWTLPFLWIANGFLALLWLTVEHLWVILLVGALGYAVLQAPENQRAWTLGVAFLSILAGVIAPFPAALLLLVMTLAGLAALLILVNPAPVSFLLPLGAFAYPLVRLRSKANTVRKRVFRTLPETAALIAAELAAGTAPDVAVARAAAIPGPLSMLLREAVETSRGTGRPLFSRKPISGTLVEVMGASGIPALHAFGSQLDLVASKGVAGAALMAEIARALGQEYRAKLQSEVEKLDSRLVLVVALFFFVPFVALLLFATLGPVLAIFAE